MEISPGENISTEDKPKLQKTFVTAQCDFQVVNLKITLCDFQVDNLKITHCWENSFCKTALALQRVHPEMISHVSFTASNPLAPLDS